SCSVKISGLHRAAWEARRAGPCSTSGASPPVVVAVIVAAAVVIVRHWVILFLLGGCGRVLCPRPISVHWAHLLPHKTKTPPSSHWRTRAIICLRGATTIRPSRTGTLGPQPARVLNAHRRALTGASRSWLLRSLGRTIHQLVQGCHTGGSGRRHLQHVRRSLCARLTSGLSPSQPLNHALLPSLYHKVGNAVKYQRREHWTGDGLGTTRQATVPAPDRMRLHARAQADRRPARHPARRSANRPHHPRDIHGEKQLWMAR